MYTNIITFFAFLAITSAASGTVGTEIHGLSLSEGLSPTIASLRGPLLRTAKINPDASLVIKNGVLQNFTTGLTPISTGFQVPIVRTVNVGPVGSTFNSVAVGGVIPEDGSVLVAPSEHAFYGRIGNQVLYRNVVPSLIPLTRSVVYTAEYNPGIVHIPEKSIVADPSGIIITK